MQLVEHGPLGRGGGQAQRGGAPSGGQSLAFSLALGLAQRQAGARVVAGRDVRRGGGLADVAAGAVALEDESARGQRRQGSLVRVGPLGLDEGLAVPVDTDRRQVLDLALGGPRALAVDVLDA